MMGPLTERASIRGKISHERRVSCPRSRVCCTTIIVTLTKKFRRKNSFFKIKATGPGVVYFVWKNVSCTYFLFNRALSSLRFWNSIIPFLTTSFEKNQNQKLSLMLHCCRSYQGQVIRLIFHHNSNLLKLSFMVLFICSKHVIKLRMNIWISQVYLS